MRSVTNLQNDKLFVNQSRAPSTGPIDSDERALLDRFSALLDEIASKVVRMGQQHSAGLSDVPEQSVTPPPAEVMTTELPSPLQSDQPDIVQSEEQSESSEPEMLAEELERDTGLQQLEREGQGAELAVDTVDTLQQTEQPAVPDDVSSISSNVVSVQTAAMVNLEPKFQSSGESSLAVKSELTPLEVFVASDSADHNPNPNFAKKRPILTNPTELARSIAEAEVESPVTEWRELSPDIQFAIRELVQRKQPVTEMSEDQLSTEDLGDTVAKVLQDILGDVRADTVHTTSRDAATLMTSLLLRQAGDSVRSQVTEVSAPTQSVAVDAKINIDPAMRKAGQPERREVTKQETTLPKKLQTRTLAQVQEILKEAVKSQDGKTISVRLDPPHLGSVKIDVTLRDGALHARIVAESSQVNALLREKAGELHSLLRELDLHVDSVSVSSGGADTEQFISDQATSQQFADSERERTRRMDVAGKDQLSAPAHEVLGREQVPVDDHWVA